MPEIQGRSIAFPVQVRDASSWAAQFWVSAARAQALIAPSGVDVAEVIPGRTLLNVVVVEYRDTDLDAYHELGIGFLVREPGAARAPVREVLAQRTGVYIHHLPVDQAFTLEAGRAIWGYPKIMASIPIDRGARTIRARLEIDGAHVLTLDVAARGWFPMKMPTPPTFTFLDGVLRRTTWEMPPTRASARFGGARLRLGDHPIAHELRSLGVPTRALLTMRVPHMRARFGPADVR